MESVKISMLALCVWTVILDLQITVLSAPFVIFPAVAGFPLGYLTYLGFSTPVQTVITVLALAGCTTSISCLFANRYSRITSKGPKYQQAYIYGVNMSLTVIAAFICLSDDPEQIPAVQLVYDNLPCISSDVRSYPVYVISSNVTLVGICIGSLIMCVFLEYLFFLTATMYHLKFKSNSKMSKRTKTLQQAFFFSVALQIMIPVSIIFLPWSYAAYSCLFDYYNQAYNNLLTLDIGLHGIVSSTSMLLIHKPYRQAIFRTGQEITRIDATSFVGTTVFPRTNLSQRNSSNVCIVS